MDDFLKKFNFLSWEREKGEWNGMGDHSITKQSKIMHRVM